MTAATAIRALASSFLGAMALLLPQASSASALGCPAYDINGAAYLFTAAGDYSLGSSLSNATATALSSSSSGSSRPSFNGSNTQCFTVSRLVKASLRESHQS